MQHDLNLQSTGIPMLDNDNYHVWKSRVIDALGLRGVQRFLHSSPADAVFDSQV
jgi:hypothetical protein